MRPINLALALLVAATLAACGGSDRPARFSAQIVFGDSLSDVGTYAVGGVAALGGGKYTINGDNTAINATLTGKNWTELMAQQLGLPAPCAAQTGLDGDAGFDFSVPVVDHPGCLSYAQGGARVTDPVGPGNKLTGSALGQLTVPVTTQVARHLALSNDRFGAAQAVFVLAGANDVFSQLAILTSGLITPERSAAAVTAMTTAGDELVALVKTRIVAKGARHVVVINLPEIASTPFGLLQAPEMQQLIVSMTAAFNDRLQAGLGSEAKVLLVDLFARSHDQAINPARYGLTDVSTPACDLNPARNVLQSSLVCNGANLIVGDVSHHGFADDVHLSPYNYALLSDFVATRMVEKGWPSRSWN